MSVQARVNSGQSASPFALDPHFIRQLRNFMNNWIVEGGNFHFDGYRARLRIDSPQEAKHPFQILKHAGLDIKIHPGTVNGFDPEYGVIPLSDSPTITLPDNATTHVFIKVDLTPGPPDPTVKYLYMVDDPVTVEIGASTPADTGISYADTAGAAYWTIAKVTTLSGEITVIDQTWTGHLWYVWSNGGHLWAGRS